MAAERCAEETIFPVAVNEIESSAIAMHSGDFLSGACQYDLQSMQRAEVLKSRSGQK